MKDIAVHLRQSLKLISTALFFLIYFSPLEAAASSLRGRKESSAISTRDFSLLRFLNASSQEAPIDRNLGRKKYDDKRNSQKKSSRWKKEKYKYKQQYYYWHDDFGQPDTLPPDPYHPNPASSFHSITPAPSKNRRIYSKPTMNQSNGNSDLEWPANTSDENSAGHGSNDFVSDSVHYPEGKSGKDKSNNQDNKVAVSSSSLSLRCGEDDGNDDGKYYYWRPWCYY